MTKLLNFLQSLTWALQDLPHIAWVCICMHKTLPVGFPWKLTQYFRYSHDFHISINGIKYINKKRSALCLELSIQKYWFSSCSMHPSIKVFIRPFYFFWDIWYIVKFWKQKSRWYIYWSIQKWLIELSEVKCF